MKSRTAVALMLSGALSGCYGGADLTIRLSGVDGGGPGPSPQPGPCPNGCLSPPGNLCEGTLVRTYGAGTCGATGCTYASTVTACPLGCSRGACVGDPCLGVSCTTPPAPTCVDGGLQVTTGVGLCTAGTCQYIQVSTMECPDAGLCQNGACVADPCLGVDCTLQTPASYCADEDTLTSFTGTCLNGTCEVSQLDTRCPYGCLNNACTPSPCQGVTCTTPPSPRCVGSLLLSYSGTGVCSSGTCVYMPRSYTCPLGCDAGACLSPDAGSDAGLVDAGFTDGGLIDGGLADAGLADGGLRDAGLTDGGLRDSGLTDGG